MKYNRFFRFLAVAIILSLLMIAIPATPALAAAVTLDPEKGEVGSLVTIKGEQFNPSQGLYIYFSSQKASAADEIGDEVTIYEQIKRVVTYEQGHPFGGGTFPAGTNFNVPAELNDGDEDELVHGGTYYVYTVDEHSDKILTVDDFTVIGIEKITPAEGSVGTRVEIEGVGFEDKEDISIEYDGSEVDIVSGDEKTGSGGDFTCRIDIPAGTAGVHTITARVEDNEGDVQFTVVPTITINPTSGAPDEEVTVTGTGFGDDVEITITFDGDAMDIGGDEDTDDYGSFESTFIVPEAGPGIYVIEVEDYDDNTAEAEFCISTSLTLSLGATTASPAHVGDQVTISGTGFKASSQMTITSASWLKSFTTTSLSDGSFSCTFTAPPSEGGAQLITVTDGENTDQITFVMESTPPSPVYPLLPLVDTKLKDWKFDWCGDADDPSIEATDDSLPITYDFQIATDSQFSTSSLRVSRVGLTTSEYTLIGEEKLESTSEEAPYYWRVRAVDAASNAGDWTSASAFYVGFNFQMPGWLVYFLIAIGVIGAFILGFWLGRRAPSEDYYY